MKWRIRGGHRLNGEVRIGGAKNTAFKLMIAALLSEEESRLRNVPDVGDVRIVSEIITALGGSVERLGPEELQVDPGQLCQASLSAELARGSRAPVLLLAALLGRFREAEIPMPGGDRIGRRPIDRVLSGLGAFGAVIEAEKDVVRVRADKLRGTRFEFPKNTHTGTEALILAAVLAEGRTVLENAASEPEVDDLIAFLNRMGAKICRVAERTITVQGVPRLHGTHFEVMPDRNEAVTFACAALITKGELAIKGVRQTDLDAFVRVAEAIGADQHFRGDEWRVCYRGMLNPAHIQTAPHPGFMSDWQPIVTALLTQTDGVSTVHETVFENRFEYVKELCRMGAKIEFWDPPVEQPELVYNFNLEDRQRELCHAIKVFGPTRLVGAEVTASDVRAGAALVLASLAADGEGLIGGIEHIERGHERLVETLTALGADVAVEL